MNRPPRFLSFLCAALLGVLLFPTLSGAAPTELLRYHGDGSSATGAALGNAEQCDVNGDGLDDAVVGAWFWDKAPLSNIGAAYVILGSEGPKGGSLNNPSAANAVRIDGPAVANAFVGFAVGCLGDVNGDGFDDVGISHYTAQKAYVVFGDDEFSAVDLGLLGSRGFEVRGNASSGNVGFSLAPVGDLDGDGLDEFGVAEVVADTQGRTNNGRIWVISGQDDVADVDLINPASGQIHMTVDGAYAEERLGVMSEVGDVNGDGTDDFLVGSYTAVPWGTGTAVPGSAAVIWGGTTGAVDLANLGTSGFRIFGPNRGRDRLGISVSGAGDLNGDGKADLIIGADGVFNAATGNRNGSAWVIFGSDSPATVYTTAPANDLTASAPTDVTAFTCENDPGTGTCASPADVRARGYRITGAANSDSTAYSVAGIGDVSGDDIPDLAIGAYGYDPVNPANPPATMSGAGAVWIVHGKADTNNQQLATLSATEGYRIDGLAAGDRMGRQVGAFGDFDGNGVNDFFAGGDFASRPLAPGTPLSQAGEVIIGLNGALKTRTDLTVSPTGQSALGQEFNLTATATRIPAGAEAVESGTFEFTIDGSPITGCESVAPASPVAECDVTPQSRGQHVFAVAYSGVEGEHLGSEATAAAVNLTDTTMTTISSSVPGELIVGHDVTFTAEVEPGHTGSAAAAGTVAFTISGQSINGCAAVPVSAGEASCVTRIDTVGDHQIGAAYSGSGDLLASTATAIEQAVIPMPVSVTDFSRGADAAVGIGESVTLSAEVSSEGDPVTQGTVDFLEGTDVIDNCEDVALTNGSAECDISFGQRGRVSLSASYSGTGDMLPSTSEATPLDVQDLTDTTLQSSAGEITVGRPVTFTASVEPDQGGAAASTGTVGFTSDGDTITGCGSVPVTDGTATCQTEFGSTGSYEVGAGFSGSDDLIASVAEPVTQVVAAAPASSTTLSLGGSPNVELGELVTLTASVFSAGDPADQGTVDFLVGGSAINGCDDLPVAAGVATCSTSFGQRGRVSLEAEYNGTISILGSSSETGLLDVFDSTALVLSATSTSVRVGEPVAVTSSVAAANGGEITGGYVELSSEGCEGCGRKSVQSGGASHSLTFPEPGVYTVGGIFGGGEWLTGSTATPLTITVTRVPNCPVVRPLVSRPTFSARGRALNLRVSSSTRATANIAPTIRFKRNGRQQSIVGGRRQLDIGAPKSVRFSLTAAQAARLPARVTVIVKSRARSKATGCVASFGSWATRNLGQVRTGRS